MSDEDALLAAICADPADDTARLAFADLLDERGGEIEAAWAQFIRAHTRLTGETELAGDIPTVMELGSDEWLGRFAARLGFPIDGVGVGRWNRGFPDELVGPYLALRERWDALLVRTPFCRLYVAEVDDAAIEDFVMWPRLDRLITLDLVSRTEGIGTPRSSSHAEMTVRGVVALAGCPSLVNLRSLSLWQLEVTNHAVELILDSRHLSQLHTLTLRATRWIPIAPRIDERLTERFGPHVFAGG